MNLYRSTINIAGCRRNESALFPDTVRTAVLVSQGVLVPVVASILERPDPEERTFAATDTAPIQIDGDIVTGDGSGVALPPFGQGA